MEEKSEKLIFRKECYELLFEGIISYRGFLKWLVKIENWTPYRFRRAVNPLTKKYDEQGAPLQEIAFSEGNLKRLEVFRYYRVTLGEPLPWSINFCFLEEKDFLLWEAGKMYYDVGTDKFIKR